jgi:uncharacterized protein YecT (DUF1311 family)
MKRTSARFAVLAALVISFCAIPAHGQHMNEKDSPCAGVTMTSDLMTCLSKASNQSQARLGSVYKDLHSRLESADAGRLAAAQRLWTRYRDANCAAERSLYDGGTAAAPAYVACLEAMTRARSRELEVTHAVKLK